MADIWVISDTHFNHANILKFTNGDTGEAIRPDFIDVEEMNEYMIHCWNSVVKPQDKVYHLGDVYFGNKKEAGHIMSRLHGHKRLILGNHDDGKSDVFQKHFDKVMLWRMFKDWRILMTHVPVHPSTLGEGRFSDMGKPQIPMLNVHGHIHQNKSPPGPYRCVCVEHIKYTPINIEVLIEQAKVRQ